jgi:hypothetical protein
VSGHAESPAIYAARRYRLACPAHPGFAGEVVGAIPAGLALHAHGCLDAYATPARLRTSSGGRLPT